MASVEEARGCDEQIKRDSCARYGDHICLTLNLALLYMFYQRLTALLALALVVGCQTMREDTGNFDAQEFYMDIAKHKPEAIETINRLSVRELNQYLFPASTAIAVAVRHRNEPAARLLIKKGVDVNRGSDDGHTPLHGVAYDNNEEMVRLLLEAGADPNKKERRYGKTPLDQAFLQQADSAGAVLKEFGAKFSQLLTHEHNRAIATAWYDSLPSPGTQ